MKTIGIILIIVAIALLIWGALYLFGSQKFASRQTIQTPPPSDEVASIEQDLAATDFGSLDAELADIEGQLGQ